MIGLVIVTHGGLAGEFLAAVEHIVGPQKQLATVSIGPDDDLEVRRRDIQSEVTAVNSGEGVIVLTDMFGGTPSNLAISIMQESEVEVIAGVNLPMLVKLASIRDRRTLAEVTEQACEAGRKYINVASEVLGRTAAT
ncbi:MAG: PTS sugar transporter subunit IIA [Pseudomonadota bacterium]